MDKKMKIISLVIWCLIAVFLTGVLIYGINSRNDDVIFSILMPQETGLKVVKQENVPLSGINNVALNFKSENITILTTEGSEFKVIEKCNRNLRENQKFSISRNKESLQIDEGYTTLNFIGLNIYSRSLELYVPKQYTDSLSVEVSSGNINLENGMTLKNISLIQQSGNIHSTGILKAENFQVKSTSGTVKLGELYTDVYNFGLTSGNLTVNLLSGSGRADCTSGNIDISFKEIKDKADISADSGNITLHVPEAVSFKFMGNSTSGNINSDFNLTYQGKGRSQAQAVNGSGEFKTINAKVISGNINLFKTP